MGIKATWLRWFGEDPHPVSTSEKLLSAAGAFLGILGLLVISHGVLDTQGTMLVVTSMGASAVLVFAAPHSPLSQPWPVLGGHLLSSAVGVACAMLIDDTLTAAAAAVALSIAVMFYTRCLHPPGGAAALATVVGGESVRALGFAYLVTPVLLNVLVLLSVAMLFNAPFPHRRYPRWLAEPDANHAAEAAPAKPELAAKEKPLVAHSDLVYALSQIDAYVDISEDDLLRIYQLATQHAQAGAASTP